MIADTDEFGCTALLAELEQLLTGAPEEQELQQSTFTDGPGSINPAGFGCSAREWLVAVHARLAENRIAGHGGAARTPPPEAPLTPLP